MSNPEGVARRIRIPHDDLAAAWSSIKLPEGVRERLLAQSLLAFTVRQKLAFEVAPLHGLILLSGAPGTGKTTIARGLANQVAHQLPGTKCTFLEIDPHALSSSALGRTQQAMTKLFEQTIPEAAMGGAAIVLLDEVETLAVSRHKLSFDANPADVHRATDAVLSGMDRLTRDHRNVLLMVRECIRTGFDVKTDFLSGSYRRHTKTKPLKDVDVMFVLGEKEKWRREKPPIEMLQAFEACLKKRFTESGQTELCRRAVTIIFEKSYYPEDHEGRVMSIDAVPAFEGGKDVYEIPDKVTGKWIKTNPKKHMEQATDKNEELDGYWVPLVKMARGWNRANGKPIKPSFLVEVMAEVLVEAPFSTYPNEVRNLFAAMEANVGASWPDPAGLGPPVSDQMTAELITAARKALQEAQRKAALAMRAEETGRQGEALRIWREVLGDYFPLS